MDPIAPMIARIQAEGRMRVWSLVITVFGDSVQHRGGQIATARLARLMGRIGVETGAMRTALSRLARDGWVASTRQGRTSAYHLTPLGQDRFGPATARIYAPPRRAPVSVWTFSTTDTPPGLAIAGGYLRPAGRAPDTGFAINGTLGAAALAEVAASLPPAHQGALRHLAQDVTDLAAQDIPDALTALAARTLLVHRWRRLVLRWPEVPQEVMPRDIAPRDLHSAVAACYHQLTPLAEAWLDSADADMAPMPSPVTESRASARFGGLQEP